MHSAEGFVESGHLLGMWWAIIALFSILRLYNRFRVSRRSHYNNRSGFPYLDASFLS